MSDDKAVLRVVRGSPTEDELAALIMVLSSRARAAQPPTTSPSSWAAYWNSQRDDITPGAGAWRASALPR